MPILVDTGGIMECGKVYHEHVIYEQSSRDFKLKPPNSGLNNELLNQLECMFRPESPGDQILGPEMGS